MLAKDYHFLGVRIDNVSQTQVLERIESAIQEQHYINIATVNPELVMTARAQADFNKVLGKAGLVTADGAGILLVGALTGRRLKQRVTGSDLCLAIAKLAAEKGWSLYLLGAAPGVAEAAASKLREQLPSLVIEANDGNPTADETPAIKKRIKDSRADILLVAYGSPKQELWLDAHGKNTGAKVTIGVGGSFDFIAGTTKRAPQIVQKLWLEWLWRLILQPWRWRRMLALPKFAMLSLKEYYFKHK